MYNLRGGAGAFCNIIWDLKKKKKDELDIGAPGHGTWSPPALAQAAPLASHQIIPGQPKDTEQTKRPFQSRLRVQQETL